MAEAIRQRLNDSPIARWTVLFIVATAMMMGYFVNDVMSPLETMLEASKENGGLGWSSSDYGFFSGSSGLINVFLLMLFFSGLILDKMGIRFTGTLACSLMVIGTLIKYAAITQDFEMIHIPIFDIDMPGSVAFASLGFAIFGVGYEMTGITVSKAMVRWFTGHELALDFSEELLRYLYEHDGYCDLGDKSPSEEIASRFGVSKKVFKQAVGDLYKRKIITIADDGLRLI